MARSGRVARYDTQAGFASAASWTTFDTTALDIDAAGFFGAVFDGRYLYLVPHHPTRSVAARYDTHADFSAAASWNTFDTVTIAPDAAGFNGGVFDGRYIYFVPNKAFQGIYTSLVTRYDTQGAFDVPASWSTFDVSKVSAGFSILDMGRFQMGAFDGRFVYLLPYSSSMPLVRFDTQKDFAAESSWTAVGLKQATSESSAGDVAGAVFDGRYLYLLPKNFAPLLRFDAGNAAALPAGSTGSFF